MKENHFFSYDFFASGLFGLSTFFLFIVFFVALITLFTTSSLVFFIEIIIKIFQGKYIQKKKIKLYFKHHLKKMPVEAKFMFFMLLLINIIFATLTFSKDVIHSFTPFIYTINLLTVIHLSVVFFAKALYGIISLILFFLAIILIGFSQPKNTNSLVLYGLNLFGSGAKNVKIKFINDNHKTISGKMLLLSPENIFITNQENNSTYLKIIKRDNIIIDVNTTIPKDILDTKHKK